MVLAAALRTVDPVHGFIFVVAGGQRRDHTRRSIGHVIMRAWCVVDAVAAASCSTTLDANDLSQQPRVFEQVDHSRIDGGQQFSVKLRLRLRRWLIGNPIFAEAW
jgi:hypothetical protein